MLALERACLFRVVANRDSVARLSLLFRLPEESQYVSTAEWKEIEFENFTPLAP